MLPADAGVRYWTPANKRPDHEPVAAAVAVAAVSAAGTAGCATAADAAACWVALVSPGGLGADLAPRWSSSARTFEQSAFRIGALTEVSSGLRIGTE